MTQRYWFLAGLAVLFTLMLGGLAARLADLSAAGESVLALTFWTGGTALTGAGLAVLSARFFGSGHMRRDGHNTADPDWVSIVGAAPVALALFDADRKLLFGNRLWRRLFKDSEGPAHGYSGESRLPDGTWLCFDEAVLEGGWRLVCAADITELHQRADGVREELDKSRLILSTAGAWAWETDVLHRFSAAYPVRAGLNQDDLRCMIGHSLAELTAPSDASSDAAVSACVRNMDRRRDLTDVRLVLRDGAGRRTVRLDGVPRTDSDGVFLGYCGVGNFEPVARPQTEPAPEPLPPPGAPPAGLGRRVLLVDDSRTNRMLGLSILRKMGYEADAVESGLKAIDAVGGCDYGVVLMDIWMPGMDGFEATAEIRRLQGPAGSIPVVAMTAHIGAEERRRCLESGMVDHVSKPVDRPVLSNVLRRLIGAAEGGGSSRKDNAAETKADAVLLDGKTLEQLRNDAGPALVGELIAAFMAETDERLPRMRTAVESGDLDTVAAEAHAMKSSSGTFGALRLQSLVDQLESAATESRPDLVSELFGRIQMLVEESWREFTRVGYPPNP